MTSSYTFSSNRDHSNGSTSRYSYSIHGQYSVTPAKQQKTAREEKRSIIKMKVNNIFLTPVQNIYGDTAHRNFEMKKKACEGAAILWPSGQMSTSEVIPMVFKKFDSQTVVIDPRRIPPKHLCFWPKKCYFM